MEYNPKNQKKPTNVEYTFDHDETPESIRFDHAIIDHRYWELSILRDKNQNDCTQTMVQFTAWRLGETIMKGWWPRHVKQRDLDIDDEEQVVNPETEHRIRRNFVYEGRQNQWYFEAMKEYHFDFARQLAVPELFNIKSLGLSRGFLEKNYFYLGNIHFNK